MSKRHQSSRRKSYGRRQHEVRERNDRTQHHDATGFDLEQWGSGAPADPLAFDPRSPRVRYLLGD
ncbi:MAG TPA: hypothetical protein VD763_10370 [Candidatus Saccharimonadales bacterium]|nr:hypothetical protein [Candidatus Saccharimonadales bacterium]